MKATLEFDLPEDKCQYEMAIHGPNWALVALGMDNKLRAWLKHGHTFKSADEALEAARTALHECMEAHGVALDMIE